MAYLGGLPAVLEQFAWSWGQMVAYNAEFLADDFGYVHQMRATISDHAPARNGLVAGFLGSWCFMVDTDHQFEPDLCARLLRLADEYDVDVLSGVYQLKNPPHVPVLYQWVKIGEEIGLQPMASWPKEAKVLQIGSAGGGCLFVRRKVFDRLAEAYPGQGAFDKIAPYSEDHSFFLRCKEQGIKCYAAMNVHCNHLRVTPVTLDDMPDGLMCSEQFAMEGYK